MASPNHIAKVAIVGAGGNVGSFMTESLLKTGKHSITALTRPDSKSKIPEDVDVKTVDYDKPETLVEALRGQDALVITISGHAPIQATEEKLVRAAAEAGVPWIMPNEWSPDSADEGIVRDVFLFGMKVATRKLIEELGKSSYIALSTGFWYEYSLAMAGNFGIDFTNRHINMYNDGQTPLSVSTWPQVGRAVAAILSLPVKQEGSKNGEACLDALRNRVVYINSFTIGQKDMLESAQRVTGTKQDDWTITKHDPEERFATAMQNFKSGKKEAFANFLYSRIFFPNGCGDFEHNKGTLNELLALPKEDLDEATKVASERQKTQQVNDGH